MAGAVSRREEIWRAVKKQRVYYLLALPGLLFFLVFHYFPITGVVLAFKKHSVFRGISASPWVGMDVFKRLFGLDGFQRALNNTLIISFFKLITGFPISILIALFLNEIRSRKLNKAVQTSIVLPHFISWVVIYGILYSLLSPSTGMVGNVYRALWPGREIPNILANKNVFRFLLVYTNTWRNAGFASIMYTAAIAGIDPTLYESAEIDGAGRLRQAIHITLPCIRSTIIIMLILRVGDILNADFEQVLALENEIVRETGDIIDTFVYRMGIRQAEYSLATAAGLFKSAVAMIFVLGTNALAKKVDPDSGIF